VEYTAAPNFPLIKEKMEAESRSGRELVKSLPFSGRERERGECLAVQRVRERRKQVISNCATAPHAHYASAEPEECRVLAAASAEPEVRIESAVAPYSPEEQKIRKGA